MTDHIDWDFTDVHSDAGGTGIEWRCPTCNDRLVWAPYGWWELRCSCEEKDWDLQVVITDGSELEAG